MGLRDYGIEGQLGLENTLEEYLDNLMKWVKEVWRVLKPTGSFVLNLGGCYLGGGRGTRGTKSIWKKHPSHMPEKNLALMVLKKGGFYKSKHNKKVEVV